MIMIKKTLIITIILTGMFSCVSEQLFAKLRMPDNRLRFILTLSEDQDGESYWNFCYSSNPMLCNTRAVLGENLTLADILRTQGIQEEGRYLEAIVLDSSLNYKINVDLQVPAGDDNRLLTVLSQYTLAYFNAGYREYTKVTPGYSLSVMDERATSFPQTKKQGTLYLDFDGTTATYQGHFRYLASLIHYKTGAFVWDKSSVKGQKYLSFTVEDPSSIESWLNGLSEIGIVAKADSAAVEYIEIFKLDN